MDEGFPVITGDLPALLASLTVRVISLPARTDRREQFSAHAAEQGIPFVFVDGHTGSSPMVNISMAHKACIRAAQANGEPYAIVMEDDCWFPSVDGYRWWLQQAPTVPFDMYLGGIYWGSPWLNGRVDKFCALHCYMVAAPFYARFLAARQDNHLDHALGGLGAYFVSLPYAAIQRDGHSDNVGKATDYHHYVYGKYRT